MATRDILRHVLIASGCGLSAVALVACSGPEQGPQAISTVSSTPSAGTSPSAPTSLGMSASTSADPASPEAKAALAAYQGMMVDWVSAALTSNYQDPALAHHASGSALTYMTQQLFIDQTEKTVAKGTPQLLDISFGQIIPASDPTEVVINSCLDDSSWLQYTTDSELFNNVPGGRHQTQVLVVESNGVWKVNQLALNKVGTC